MRALVLFFLLLFSYAAHAQNALTELNNAIKKGDKNKVEEIFQKNKIEINKLDEKGYAPMHYAAENGNVEIGKFLYANGADVNIESEQLEDERTTSEKPIHRAAKNKKIAFVKFLIETGADINAKGGSNKITTLHIAASNKDTSLIKYLIFSDIEIDATDDFGLRALHYAIKSNCAVCVEILLDNRSSADDGRVHGAIPLFLAIENNNVEIARLLVKNGADVNNRYKPNENTPLHTAIEKGNLDMVLMLIANDADMNETAGDPPLNALQLTEKFMAKYKNDKVKYANYYKMAGYIKKAYNPKK